MTIVAAFILGIVEGLTEFLPISSTAHLELASRVLNVAQTDFWQSFIVAIQLGAIAADAVLYIGVFFRRRDLWKKIIAAFIPTGIVGFALYKLIKNYLIGNLSVALWALALGGIAIIAFEVVWGKREPREHSLSEITYKQAFWIGLVQSLAVIPGISRAAATIIAGMAAGISRSVIVEFSFLLAIPTMIAATGYDLLKSASAFSTADFGLLGIGFISAFITAALTMVAFLRFVKTNNFIPFGIYRIALVILVIILIVI